MTVEHEMAVRRLVLEEAGLATDTERLARITHAVPDNAGSTYIKVRADDIDFLCRLARHGLVSRTETHRLLTNATMELINPLKTP